MREFVTVSGMRCEVERQRATARQRSQGWPFARVEAPEGYEFSGGETALEVHSASDLDEIEQRETLVVAG